VLRVLVAAFFVFLAGRNLSGDAQMAADFQRWGYADWFRTATALVQMLGALALLVPATRPLGALLLLGVLFGAIATHVRPALSRMAEALATGAINNNEAFVLDGVRFKDRSAILTSASNTQLTALATLLRKYPAIDIRIEAHTDNDGNVKDNLDLSVQQALAVKNHLHQNSIPAIRIAVAGRGQYKPLSVNNTAAGKAMNNRIEIYLNKKE
jgi:hypothetical protein